jgi:hypothetical protein
MMRRPGLSWVMILPLVMATCAGVCLHARAEDNANAEDGARKKIVDRLNRNLGRLKPVGSPKKEVTDFFVVGTAKLTKATGHADVCFQVKQGQRVTAEFVFDFMADASVEHPRNWHVFCRLKGAQDAEQALLAIRTRYDQLASYRDEIKRTYQARTVRRC